MDVLGSRWAKIAILVVAWLFAAPVSAGDRLAEALLQGWSEAIKSGTPISGRFTTFRYDTAFNRFGEGVGSFRQDEFGRLSVTVRDTLDQTLSALQPFNLRRFPMSSGSPWSQQEFPAYSFTEEEDGWYYTNDSSDGRENRVRLLGLPSALDPSNTRNGLRRFFLFSTPEMTATGVFSVPLFLPTLKGIEYVRSRTERVSSEEMAVRCVVLVPMDPEVSSEGRTNFEIVTIFRRDNPLPRAISLEKFPTPSHSIRWVFHELNNHSQ